MLVSIVALALVTAIAAAAQSGGGKLKADIPFDFVVGDKTLAAGEYTVGQISTSSSDAIMIRNSAGGHKAMRITNAVASSAPKRRTQLTFHRYGNTYYLSQIWVAGSAEGRQMLKSKQERVAERELARNSAAGNLAGNDQPETVTITAEAQ
jgi:hypothetical protein